MDVFRKKYIPVTKVTQKNRNTNYLDLRISITPKMYIIFKYASDFCEYNKKDIFIPFHYNIAIFILTVDFWRSVTPSFFIFKMYSNVRMKLVPCSLVTHQ